MGVFCQLNKSRTTAAASSGCSIFIKGIFRDLIIKTYVHIKTAKTKFILAGFSDDNAPLIDAPTDDCSIKRRKVPLENPTACSGLNTFYTDSIFYRNRNP